MIERGARVAEGAAVHPSARIEAGAVVEDGATVGENCVIRAGAVILGGTTLEEGVEVGWGAILGAPAQHLQYHDKPGRLHIRRRAVIREYVTIHRGTERATEIGESCYLMAFCHIGHDCRLEEGVIIAQATALGGFCEVGAHAFIGGGTFVHQKRAIGERAIVGGLSGVMRHVLPFARVLGAPDARFLGVNHVGLERAGFPPDERAAIGEALRRLRKAGSKEEAVREIREQWGHYPSVRRLLRFAERYEPLCL